MKIIFAFAFLISFQYINAQLISGDLVDANRRLLTESNFTIKGSKEGVIVYDLAVDIYGNVTSQNLVSNMTTVTSTPMKIDAKNYISKFKFEPGTAYPKFHHVKVKITFVL